MKEKRRKNVEEEGEELVEGEGRGGIVARGGGVR